ncbi:hypothetical protein HK100_010541, partial [Physocladia obscura]
MLANRTRERDATIRRQTNGNSHNAPAKQLPDFYCNLQLPPAPAESSRFSSHAQDYEIGAIIGRGGFAVVHQAVSKHPASYGVEVAIKIIDKAVMAKANLAERVVTELAIHSSLNHPAILQLYTHFQSPSHVYLVTELCTNNELYRYIQRRTGGCLTEAEARGVTEEIVKGVLYLHAHGIIHRDLKLSNVLITRDYHVKISDFGLAVKLNNPDGEQKTMCGTPNYISPEIVSRQPYGLSSDLWSLGCMLVTMLTGKPPFDSQAVKSTLDKVSRVEYYLPDSISDDAKDLISRLLMKDPKKRLTLRDILSHKWFSLPRLALKPEKPLLKGSRSDFDQNSPNNNNHEQYQDRSPSFQKKQNFHDSQSAEQTARLNEQETQTNQCNGQFPAKSQMKTAKLSTVESLHRYQKTENNPVAASHQPCVVRTGSFTTKRLKTMQQKTKHGNIAILGDGNILLDFYRESNLILISGDSKSVYLYDRSRSSASASIQDLNPHTTYDSQRLPSNISKIHAYAVKFVDLVRSKTPKIIFYSPQAKCLLMENTPQADFEMNFYSGVKVHHSSRTARILFKIPATVATAAVGVGGTLSADAGNGAGAYDVYEYDVSGAAASSASAGTTAEALQSAGRRGGVPGIMEIPATLVNVFRHVQECLRQCLDIEKSTSIEGDGGTYPLILKSSNIGNLIGSVGGGGGDDIGGYVPVSGKGFSPIPSVNAAASSVAALSAVASAKNPDIQVTRSKSRISVAGTATTLFNGDSKYASTSVSTTARSQNHLAPNLSPKMNYYQHHNYGVGRVNGVTRHSNPTTGEAPSIISATTAAKQSVVTSQNTLTPSSVTNADSGGIAEKSSGNRRQVFLEKVGWCSRDGDGRFVMLFNDGVHMIVDSRDQNLVWIDAAGMDRKEI